MALTGEERIPLLTKGGPTIRVRDVATASGLHVVPLLRAAPGGTGNSMTVAEILAAGAELDDVRIPLVSGGSFVTVGEVRDFA